MSAATFCSAPGSSASTSSLMNTFDRPVPARDTRTDAVPLRATWQADEAMAHASLTATRATWDNATHDRCCPAWANASPGGGQLGANAMLVIITPSAGQGEQLTTPEQRGFPGVTPGASVIKSVLHGSAAARRDVAWLSRQPWRVFRLTWPLGR